MVVLIVESAPPGLRGQLSKWMLEPKAGVFVGTVSAAVRDLLWEKACAEIEEGGATLIYRADNEQGFAIRNFGDTTRQVEEWEGLFLVRRPNPAPVEPAQSEAQPQAAPPDFATMLHPHIWAKTARGVTLAPGEPDWHPLICHMVDVAMVAQRIWQYLLPPIVRSQMTASLGLASPEAAGRWIAFFAGLHDLGKASPGFAFKWSDGKERLQAEGFKPGKESDPIGHAFLSTHLISDLLKDWGISAESAWAIGHAVGGHHGAFPDPNLLMQADLNMGGKRWQRAQRELVQVLAHMLDVSALPVPTGNLLTDNPFIMRLAGLTSVADWIGSNHDYFPFVGDAVRLNRYAHRAGWQALGALIDLGWFRRPEPAAALPFTDLFPFAPNRLQTQLADVAEQLSGPSLVLLEYPMGGGKTEGALYLANTLQATAGQQGLYLALPTMATSNQMFLRLAEYLQRRFPGVPINLQLLHGRSDLHPTFARLRRQARRKQKGEAPVIEDETEPIGSLLAAEWFTRRKQSLLAPFGVGTVDQALLAALNTKHYFVRLFGLAGKVVVLDEVHAYDAYMQSLLGHLLTWLAACGSSVILLSATLPSRTRTELLAAFGRGLGHTADIQPPVVPYPRVTWLSAAGADARSIDDVPSRTVALRPFGADAPDWMADLRSRLADGGCAAVICNTVGRAQLVYQALGDHFPEDERLLFHARFPFDARMQLENEVLERFGKKGDGRPFRMVCVATQVIEQSLDIDFDLMVSDLAPVDLVLQRSGRIWRHQRAGRPAGLDGPTLWLLLPPTGADGVPQLARSDTAVYDAHLLLRSLLVLRNRDAVSVPDDVEGLIETVYQPAEPPPEAPPALAAFWGKTADNMLMGTARDQSKARVREIPDVAVELVNVASPVLDDESEEVHTAHQAMTRLGGPSVEVVCLYEREGRTYLDALGGNLVDLRHKPQHEEIRRLLGQSLRISFNPRLVKQILALPVPPEWEATAHLRRHRLLRFDFGGNCLTADLPLILDPVLGLYQRSLEKEAEV